VGILLDIFVFLIILPVLMSTAYISAKVCIFIGILPFHPHLFYTRYTE